MTDSYVKKTADGTVMFAGRDAVELFRTVALRRAIILYAKCGMKVNRMWTPAAMLATAGSITGKGYKRGQFDLAIADLSAVIDAMRAVVPVGEG